MASRKDRLERYTIELSDLELEILSEAVTAYLLRPENFGKLEATRETMELLQGLVVMRRMKAAEAGIQW